MDQGRQRLPKKAKKKGTGDCAHEGSGPGCQCPQLRPVGEKPMAHAHISDARGTLALRRGWGGRDVQEAEKISGPRFKES